MDSSKLIVSFYAKNIVAIVDKNLEIECFYRLERPMGIAPIDNNQFYVIGKEGLFLFEYRSNFIVLKNLKKLYFNNYHDCHKLNNIILVNSKLGIIEEVEGNYYQPAINPNMTKDNHINCVAIKDNKIKYMTAFSEGTHTKAIEYKGILYDCQKEKVILKGLNKPHTPKLYKNQLWFCNSGEGTLNKGVTPVHYFETFTRGLAFINNFVYVGLSCMRRNKSYLTNSRCGIAKLNITTNELIQEKIYKQGLQIYDIQLLK